MNTKDKVRTKKFSVYVSEEMYEKIVLIASKKNVAQSEIVRDFVEKGLCISSYVEEQNMLRKMIHEEIEVILNKQVDRIIKLQVKATRASSAAMFAMAKVVADQYMDDASAQNVLANSLKQAAIYMKAHEKPDEEYRKEAAQLLNAAKTINKVNDC